MSLGVFVLAIAIISLLTASHNQQLAKNRIAEVRITPTGFQPSTLVVKLGTKVTWTNADNSLHQVASNPYPTGKDLPSLKSEILNNTQTYTYVANTAGSFGYHDQLKPTINGNIVIQK